MSSLPTAPHDADSVTAPPSPRAGFANTAADRPVQTDAPGGPAIPSGDGLPSGLREGYADIGDQRLHYVEAGEGPLVVLLHGFPEFWFGWRAQIAPLGRPALTPEETDRYIEAWSQPGASTGMINYYRSSVRTSPKKAEAALRPIQAPTLVIWETTTTTSTPTSRSPTTTTSQPRPS